MRPLLSAFVLCSVLLSAHASQLPPAGAQEQPAPAQALPTVTSESSQATSPPSANAQSSPASSMGDVTPAGLPVSERAAIAAPAAPALDGKPGETAPCAHKDKECEKKRKEMLHHKSVDMRIENGTLTVDGWTGKARLNYEVHDVTYLYISVPGVGTVIASMHPFPSAAEQKNALDGKTLTLKIADDHVVQLSSDQPLVDKKQHTLYLRLDTAYVQPGRFPSMGYGAVAQAPYVWPGTRPPTATQQKASAAAPPLPGAMRAPQAQLPCPFPSTASQSAAGRSSGTAAAPDACGQPVIAVSVPPTPTMPN